MWTWNQWLTHHYQVPTVNTYRPIDLAGQITVLTCMSHLHVLHRAIWTTCPRSGQRLDTTLQGMQQTSCTL